MSEEIRCENCGIVMQKPEKKTKEGYICNDQVHCNFRKELQEAREFSKILHETAEAKKHLNNLMKIAEEFLYE